MHSNVKLNVPNVDNPERINIEHGNLEMKNVETQQENLNESTNNIMLTNLINVANSNISETVESVPKCSTPVVSSDTEEEVEDPFAEESEEYIPESSENSLESGLGDTEDHELHTTGKNIKIQ